MSNANLAPDVARLVIAARIVAFEDKGEEAIKELDEASEAFADRVPWDDEPHGEDIALSTPKWEAIADEHRIDQLRLAAFKSNADKDRQAYFDAVSKWFQDRHYRRLDEAAIRADQREIDAKVCGEELLDHIMTLEGDELDAALHKLSFDPEQLLADFNRVMFAKMCKPREPTEAMLNAARDWSVERFHRGIGNAAAIGCWQAMYDADASAIRGGKQP